MRFRPSRSHRFAAFMLSASSLVLGAASPKDSPGRRVFVNRPCVACHSIAKMGGSAGPPLDTVGSRRSAASLRRKIVEPRFDAPASPMPAVPLSPRELDVLVAFLTTLKPPEPPPTPSPPVHAGGGKPEPKPQAPVRPSPVPPAVAPTPRAPTGSAAFDHLGCRGCHVLGGRGGVAGPSLDDEGLRRDRAWIRIQVENPKAHNPATIMPPATGTPTEIDEIVEDLLTRRGGTPPGATPAASPGPPQFVGSAACLPCHRDLSRDFTHTVHADALLSARGPADVVGCESCHGPGSAHASTGDPAKIVQPAKLTPRRNSEVCLRCHTGQVNVRQWITSAHGQAGLACSTCHVVMRQIVGRLLRTSETALCLQCHRKQTAEFHGVSRHPVLEGRIACTDCHNPHSGVHDAMLNRPVDRLCISCHGDKQGPFQFEHPAVNAGFTEGCLSCHVAHGAPLPDLRRIAGRGLCLQCHSDKAVRHFDAYPDCTSAGCHVKIHGSHEDALFLK